MDSHPRNHSLFTQFLPWEALRIWQLNVESTCSCEGDVQMGVVTCREAVLKVVHHQNCNKTQSQTWSMITTQSFGGLKFASKLDIRAAHERMLRTALLLCWQKPLKTELNYSTNHCHISQLTYHQDALQGREPNRLTHEFGSPSGFFCWRAPFKAAARVLIALR